MEERNDAELKLEPVPDDLAEDELPDPDFDDELDEIELREAERLAEEIRRATERREDEERARQREAALAWSTEPGAGPDAVLALAKLTQSARGPAASAARVELYWRIGEHIDALVRTSPWGDAVVEKLAEYLRQREPRLRGFSRASLFRMLEFRRAYLQQEFVAFQMRQLAWLKHLLILNVTQSRRQRRFLVRAALRAGLSASELGQAVYGFPYDPRFDDLKERP